MRALLLANDGDADPGFVGEHLRRHGYVFEECHRERPAEWPALAGVDLVVSLGSEWSVYWDHVAESVTAERDLLRAAHGQGIPVLGICFGGQMLSSALGGSVDPAPEPEIGWFDVSSTVGSLAGTGPWFQWHADRFTPPPGAARLAASPRAEQAYRLGRTLALQFHPEVDESIVVRWAAEGASELTRRGVDAEALVARTLTESERAREASSTLVDWFLAEVAGAGSGDPTRDARVTRPPS